MHTARPLKRVCFLMMSTLLLAWSAAAAADPAPGSVTVHADHPEDAFVFSPQQAQNHYIRDFICWAAEDDGNLPRREAVLAVGSSSMRMWETIQEDLAPLEIVHRGFGGSRMKDVLEMIDFFQRYECGTVLVYEGDNDLAGPWLKPETYAEQCSEFTEAIFAVRPDAHIYFISTKPSPCREAAMERFAEANERVQKLCDGNEQLHFIDVFTPMLNDDGAPRADIFKSDRLHMNEKGYVLWTEAVRDALFAEKD